MQSPATGKRRRVTALTSVRRAVVVIGLLAGGIAFTVHQRVLEVRRPISGVRVAGAVIEAPPSSREAFRISAVLRRYTGDSHTADRIAGAIVNEGVRRDLDPALLVGVVLTEDATLDTAARSTVGARGLMQVMPGHAGKWGCSSSNLLSIESNICHGASILEDNVRNSPNVRSALLKYNGCVSGSNTPGCHSYPDRVIRAANRTTAQMLAAAG